MQVPNWPMQLWHTLRERVEELYGVRGNRKRHAVRFSDLELYDQRLVDAATRGAAEADGDETSAGAGSGGGGSGSSGEGLPIGAANKLAAIASGQGLAKIIGTSGVTATEMVVVGSGRNLIINSRFRHGLDNWPYTISAGAVDDETDYRIQPSGTPWSGGLYPTMLIDQQGNAQGATAVVQYVEIIDTEGETAPGVPVVPNRWLEISAHVSAHRCRVEIEAVFYQASGEEISTTVPDANATTDDVPGPSDAPLLWPQIYVKVQAPFGAAYCSLRLRKFPTNVGEASSQMFVYGAQITTSTADKEDISPFSPDGTTLIDGKLIMTGTLDADDIKTGQLTADFITIDKLLTIDAVNAGFSMGRENAFDLGQDGIYLGRTESSDGSIGFGFSVGRQADGLQEYIQHTKDVGLEIVNARFGIGGGALNDTTLSTSQTFDIDPGTNSVDLVIVGGGGAGVSRRFQYKSTGFTDFQGTSGGTTTVEIYDGANPVPGLSWTAAGGLVGGAGQPNGGNSAVGTGGTAGGNPSGRNATGIGAGGGGSGQYSYSEGDPVRVPSSNGGAAGQQIVVKDIDVSALTDPKVVVTAGAAGIAAIISPANYLAQNGGNGSPGGVRVSEVTDLPQPGTLVSARPTFSGVMLNTGPYPDLGAGFWHLSTDGGNYDIGLGVVEISTEGEVVTHVYGHYASFFSNKTPVQAGFALSARNVTYRFFPTGYRP